MSTGQSADRRWAKLLLAAGYLALAAGILEAYASPATGYEQSVYAGTPVGFWLAFVAALAVATAGAFLLASRLLRGLALGLGGLAVAAFWSLPILRGYHYFGFTDALTHLGWVRDLAAGVLQPVDLIYPGLHTESVLVASLTGMALPRAALVAVASFMVLYVLFVTLTVRRLTSPGMGTAVGAASALLLLPINVIVIQPAPHPISQTAFYFALVLFLFVGYVTIGRTRAGGPSWGTGMGLLFLLALVSLVLYHPQGAAAVLILFGAISAAQFAGRRLGRADDYRSLYLPTALLAGWLGVWMTYVHPGLAGQASRVLDYVLAFLLRGELRAGEVVAQRGASLQQAGGGLAEAFLKLFFVESIFVLLTAGFVFAVLLGRFDADPDVAGITRYLTYGLAILVPWTFLQFVGPISRLVFRYLGFLMVIATVLGACAIYYVAARPVSTRGGFEVSRRARIALVVLFVPLLVVSLGTTYPSAFLLQPSGHMTEAQFDGYETVFTYQDDDVQVADVGPGAGRYRHAVEGTAGNPLESGPGPGADYDHDLPGFIRDAAGPDGLYLVVTEFDRVTQADVYRGIRFDRSDFAGLETDTELNRVTSNGEVQLYQYAPDDEAQAEAGSVR